jgi:hypothetical protein
VHEACDLLDEAAVARVVVAHHGFAAQRQRVDMRHQVAQRRRPRELGGVLQLEAVEPVP